MALTEFVKMSVVMKDGYRVIEFGNDVMLIAVSLVIAWMVHRRKLPARKLVALGLAYGVFATFNNTVGECFILVVDEFSPVAYFSFNQAWVVFFPASCPFVRGLPTSGS